MVVDALPAEPASVEANQYDQYRKGVGSAPGKRVEPRQRLATCLMLSAAIAPAVTIVSASPMLSRRLDVWSRDLVERA